MVISTIFFLSVPVRSIRNARIYLVNTEKELNIETSVINVEPVLIDTNPRDSPTFAINSVISNNLMDRLKILRIVDSLQSF